MLRAAKTKTKDVLKGAVFSGTDELRYLTRLSAGFSKGGLARSARRLDRHDTRTWEFSAFSQNGEDGVIEELLGHIESPNHYFVEIGASDGLENNVSYLAFVKKYCGVMVEGDTDLSATAKRHLQHHNWGVEFVSMMVEPQSAAGLIGRCFERAPDFFSLDIDGNDYHVVQSLLEGGFRPKTLCLEYNSAFGPDQAVTIPYQQGFVYQSAHPSQLYYGVSIAAWRHLLAEHGYDFVTVETNGVNAFFVDPHAMSLRVDELHRLEFAENFAQRQRFRGDWKVQLPQLEGMQLLHVDKS